MNPIDYEINKELGECYLFMGEYEKAQDYYEKALACDTSKSDPHMGLAAIALNAGQLDVAYAHYRKADSLASNDKTLAGMGMMEVEGGEYELAFAHFMASLDANPLNMVSINGIVQLGYFLKKLEAVVPFLEKAIIHDDTNNEAIRYTLAGCLTALGRSVEAKEHLEIILGANPGNSEAQHLYAQFAA